MNAPVSGELKVGCGNIKTFHSCRSDDVGKNIVRAAKEIISNQQNELKQKGVEEKFTSMQKQFDDKFEKIERSWD